MLCASESPPSADLDFVDLNRPSREAWEQVDAMAPGRIEDVFSAPDPLSMTLRAFRLQRDPTLSADLEERLTVLFGDALDRCHLRPLACARAVIEAARLHSLLSYTSRWAEKALALLETLDPANAPERRLLALKALADAYRADELRVIGELALARPLLDAALGRVPEGEIEIRARILEISSSLALAEGDPDAAKQALLEAGELVSTLDLRGRLAEIRLRQGRLAIRLGQGHQALGLLRLAQDDLPSQRDVRLRLEVFDELLALHVSRRSWDEASKVLRTSRHLYDHPVSDVVKRAGLDRMRGLMALHHGRTDEGLTLLLTAVRPMLDHHRVDDVLFTLTDLYRAWPRQVNRSTRNVLVGVLDTLRRYPPIHRLDPARLLPLRELAKRVDQPADFPQPAPATPELVQVH